MAEKREKIVLTDRQKWMIGVWIDTEFYPLVDNLYYGGWYSKTDIRRALNSIYKNGNYWHSDRAMLNQIRDKWIKEKIEL